MLEETATIVQVEDDSVWVETRRRSTCSSCAAKQGCGTALLDKVFSTRNARIRVLAKPGYRAGEEVIIGIREQALVRGSLAVYLVPLLALLAGALLGTLLSEHGFGSQPDLAAIFFGVAGFVAGLLWLRRFTRQISSDQRYQPVVLRRILPTGTHPVTG